MLHRCRVCKRARAHERAQRAAGVQVATPTQAETTLCFKVKEVIGVSLCMEQMSAAEVLSAVSAET